MAVTCVRSSALDGWQRFMSSQGYRTESMKPFQNFAQADAEAERRIPLRGFVDFSECVVRDTKDVAIPWLVGRNYSLQSLGPVGDAVCASTSVGSALRRFVEYFALLQDCTDIRIDSQERTTSLSYRILDPNIWPRHQDAMFSFGILAQILCQGSTDGWDQVEFHFEASASMMTGDIQRVVDAPCSFEADTNMFRFPTRFLDRAIEPCDRAAPINELNRQIADKNRSSALVERLAQVVYRDLDQLGIDQERVAREVGMSSRTMRRHLATEGHSFQQVLDECRMRQAVFEFRTKPDLSIAQIALRLGYSEHSTFTRAFRRWSGVSPQACRKQMAQ
ncbi:helix-turn-helix domain-containing protein [Aurantiacibacter rhizosphaerae]|nr:AraC family transcriptional regulator [Aurantiacibacter rhizosphaerae]